MSRGVLEVLEGSTIPCFPACFHSHTSQEASDVDCNWQHGQRELPKGDNKGQQLPALLEWPGWAYFLWIIIHSSLFQRDTSGHHHGPSHPHHHYLLNAQETYPYDPAIPLPSECISKGNEVSNLKYLMFIAALFTIVNTWKHTKCLEWRNG